jgi:hypothetical protein
MGKRSVTHQSPPPDKRTTVRHNDTHPIAPATTEKPALRTKPRPNALITTPKRYQ